MYHATRDVLKRLDNVQLRFLRDAGISEQDALFHFNLAPLSTRRDIAMLGVIHRTILGRGPPHFKEFFKRAPCVGQRHRFHLADVREPGPTSKLLTRSVFGLVAVYNLLPEQVFECKSIKHFQRNLQELVKQRASSGCEDWTESLSPRLPMQSHPLQLC